MTLARALSVAGLLVASACGGYVPPYQRGRVVQPTMQPKPPLDSAFDEHVADLRESAIGASAGEGASCGCR
ncbi:MAG: DUF4266 domain-containing protein [Polyangiaceae bacterium]|nr:DUF4266 domain-containing protein [Polyangiaceae bacterium]